MTPQEEKYRTIPLTQGRVTIVDAADYDWLIGWDWFAARSKTMNKYYAMRHSDTDYGKRFSIRMHREILGLSLFDGNMGDHRNGDTLDNRRSNLRIVTPLQNALNAGLRKDNSSGYKGVHWNPKANRWRSRISVSGKRVLLGDFLNPEDAYVAYCEAAKLYHREYARLG